MKQALKKTIASSLASLMLLSSAPLNALAAPPQVVPPAVIAEAAISDFEITDSGVLTQYTGSDTNVVIPDTVKVIGNGIDAIFGSSVESVTIPASVTEIAANAFDAASGLNNVTFAPDSKLNKIGAKAFYLASGLEMLTIPEGVTEIGAQAFVNMHALQELNLPASLEVFGPSQDWVGLMFLVNLSGNPSANLTAVNVAEGCKILSSQDGVLYSGDGKTLLFCPAAKTTIQWKPGVETIATNAFYKTNQTSVVLPDTVKTVETKAFYSGKLTSVSFPTSVETIGTYAFYNSKVQTVSFEEGLKTIGSSAFGEVYFPAGTEIVLPASLQEVQSDAFGCLGDSGAASIKVLGKNTVLANGFMPNYAKNTLIGYAGSTAEAYAQGPGSKLTFQILSEEPAPDLSDFQIEDGVLVKYTGSDTNVVIPDTVKVIGNGIDAIFGGSVESVSIPASVTEIASNAFNYANGLKTVTFAPDSKLTKVGEKAFYLAASLETLTIPEGVKEIGTQAFVNTHALKTLNLPASLEVFGPQDQWIGLMFSVNQTGSAPAKLTAINVADGCKALSSFDGALYSADGKTLLYCPAAKSTLQWKDGVEIIGSYALSRSKLTALTIPASVTAIADNAFNRSELASLDIPGTVKTIGKSAFFFSKLANVVLNEGLLTIEDSAFSQSRVSGVSIPASVTSIGKNAFDFEYGSDYYIHILGKNTVLADEFIPYYYNIKVYGLEGSTAETYVANKKAEKGDSCKLIFLTEGHTAVTGITLSQTTAELQRQQTLQLNATLLPTGAVGSIGWSSSVPTVAKVSDSGLVTALQPGKTVITASAGDFYATCTVEVVIKHGESDFTVDESGAVTGYLGTDWHTLNIPAQIDGKAVTAIAEGAFRNHNDIVTVVLPDSITAIGKEAFLSCSKLETINLNHVTTLGEAAFSHCTSLESAVLAEGLTTIPKDAFMGCSALQTVTLPSTIEVLGEASLLSCSSLTALTLPEGLTTICKDALRAIPLTTLHLPATIEHLGESYVGDIFEVPGSVPANTAMTTITVASGNPLYSSFDGLLYNKDQTTVLFCPRGRTSAVVKDGVTTIGDHAFFMCFDLETVTLPDTLKTVERAAFQYCEGITSMTLPDGLERVEDSGFFGCENWNGVEHIPSTVEYIGPYGFAECKADSITVPDGIETIEEFAFWGYEDTLHSLSLPTSLREIKDSGFSWAKNLTTLVIPEGVTSIGRESFARTDNLTSLTLPSTLKTIDEKAFSFSDDPNMTNKLLEVYIPSTVTTIAENAFIHRDNMTVVTDSSNSAAARFAKANNLTLRVETEAPDPDFEVKDGVLVAYHGSKADIVIPDGIVKIAPHVFEGGEEGEEGVDLQSVTIPASVEVIGEGAFYGSTLKKVTFLPGSQLKTIEKEAFAYNSFLEEIVLPEGLETIGQDAFQYNGKLSTLVIPASVTTLENGAFQICGGLTSVTFAEGSKLKTVGDNCFYNCSRLTELEFPEGLETIGDNALRITRNLKHVYLPASLKQLGSAPANVFASGFSLLGAEELQSITVAPGNEVYSSHDGILYSADGKTLLYCPIGKTGTVTVQDGTERIDSQSFQRSKADHVVLPDSLLTIGEAAFPNSALTSLELPDSVTTIEHMAFYFCNKLKAVQLGSGLETIGSSAFGESPVAGIVLPAGVKNVGAGAFDSLKNYAKVEGTDTVLDPAWISGYAPIAIYGHTGSTAEAFYQAKKQELGDKCKLTFTSLDAFVPVSKITVTETSISLMQKETYQLNPTVQPENATHQDLVYKSLNSGKADVSASGLITAKQPGEAIIRISSTDGVYCDVTVTILRDETISDFELDDRGYITGYTGTDADLIIPDTVLGQTVKGIAQGAFQKSRVLRSVTLPDTVEVIEDHAFEGCRDLGTVNFGTGLRHIGASAFEECSYLNNVVLPEGLETMGNRAFGICEMLETVTIPSTLDRIPDEAFIMDWRMKELEIPEGVSVVGANAFYECEGMTKLTLPKSLRTIEEGAFTACVRLEEVTIPEGVTTIDRYAFMSCTAMTTLHLPASLTKLGRDYPGDVFEQGVNVLGCNNLVTLTVAPGSKTYRTKDNLLYSADGKTLLFSPRGLAEAVVAEGTEALGLNSFFFSRKLTNVTLPDSLRTIGKQAFFACDALEHLIVPEGVTVLGDYALGDCSKLKTLSLPDSLETVGTHAITSTALETLTIPESVKTLGDQALAYNTDLKKVEISSGVRTIGEKLLDHSDQAVIYTDSKEAPIYAYAKENNIPVVVTETEPEKPEKPDRPVTPVKPSTPAQKTDLPFRDVMTSDWYYEAVQYVYDNDMMNGISATQFAPDMTVTRGMIVTILWRHAGGPIVSSNLKFQDVNETMYYADAIRWAASVGIANGFDAKTFGPDAPINREQLAAFLYRYAQYHGMKTSGSALSYSDADQISDWAREALSWCTKAGIMNGNPDGTLAPQGSATRAQAAAMLMRFCMIDR